MSTAGIIFTILILFPSLLSSNEPDETDHGNPEDCLCPGCGDAIREWGIE